MARNAAKKSATLATYNALKVGLDMFRNDHERAFRRTNGYPPSFAHPPISSLRFEAHLGQFPFVDATPPPVVMGAHWLPAMLMGVDGQGYIKPATVPDRDNLPAKPWLWYEPDPLKDGTTLERVPLYVDPGGLKLVRTEALPGSLSPNEKDDLFPDWGNMRHLPVIVDKFDQPILYYVANANGRATNMVARTRHEKNIYTGGPQLTGPPFYFHEDNRAFTGDAPEGGDSKYEGGWDFGEGPHAIARPGHTLTAKDIRDEENRETFARFILERKQYQSLLLAESTPSEATPLRPVNPDTYLLISAGVDGRYGTNDDITNFPTSVED